MTGQDSEAKAALAAEALCWRCPSDHFTFATTEDLEALSEVIGQDRAVEAIRFAIGMHQSGYNVYALGPEGMGPDGDIVVRDGDIIYVPERSQRENAVYVFGAATVQGLFDFRAGMTLLELLGAAQPQPYAKLGEIAIYRKGADDKANRIAAGGAVLGKRPDIPLQRNDLVIVPGSPPGAPKRGPFDLLVPLLYLLL